MTNDAYISPMVATLQAYRTRLLIELAMARGMTLAECLAKTTMRASDMAQSQWVFSIEDQIRIIANVGRGLPDQDIGLQMGQRIGILSRDRVGIWLASMETLQDIVQAAERFQTLLQSPMRGYVTIQDDVAHLRFEYRDPVDPNTPSVRLHTECVAASLVTTIAQIIGRPLAIVACQFAHDRPCYHQQYAAMFTTSIQFSQSFSGVSFLATELQARSIFSQQIARQAYDAEAEEEYRALHHTRNVVEQVRQQLEVLPNGKSDLNQVATRLGISPRTLRRRLMVEGETFRGLREAYLREQAETLLTGSGLSIEAVALRLGYSDASNFRRALRRWKGQSPGEVRQQGLSG